MLTAEGGDRFLLRGAPQAQLMLPRSWSVGWTKRLWQQNVFVELSRRRCDFTRG